MFIDALSVTNTTGGGVGRGPGQAGGSGSRSGSGVGPSGSTVPDGGPGTVVFSETDLNFVASFTRDCDGDQLRLLTQAGMGFRLGRDLPFGAAFLQFYPQPFHLYPSVALPVDFWPRASQGRAAPSAVRRRPEGRRGGQPGAYPGRCARPCCGGSGDGQKPDAAGGGVDDVWGVRRRPRHVMPPSYFNQGMLLTPPLKGRCHRRPSGGLCVRED